MEFMRAHPFVTLMGVDAGHKPVATQVPVLFAEKDGGLVLRGHIMKGNDHHKAFLENPHALVLFTGPHCYVSASWYVNPQQGSTWNYMSVHAKGELIFLDDAELPMLLDELTSQYEKAGSPSLYKNLPAEYITRLSKAISAFEIGITAIEHVFKLSQNRDQQSFQSILQHLEKGDANEKAIAEEMRKRKEQFFDLKSEHRMG